MTTYKAYEAAETLRTNVIASVLQTLSQFNSYDSPVTINGNDDSVIVTVEKDYYYVDEHGKTVKARISTVVTISEALVTI